MSKKSAIPATPAIPVEKALKKMSTVRTPTTPPSLSSGYKGKMSSLMSKAYSFPITETTEQTLTKLSILLSTAGLIVLRIELNDRQIGTTLAGSMSVSRDVFIYFAGTLDSVKETIRIFLVNRGNTVLSSTGKNEIKDTWSGLLTPEQGIFLTGGDPAVKYVDIMFTDPSKSKSTHPFQTLRLYNNTSMVKSDFNPQPWGIEVKIANGMITGDQVGKYGTDYIVPNKRQAQANLYKLPREQKVKEGLNRENFSDSSGQTKELTIESLTTVLTEARLGSISEIRHHPKNPKLLIVEFDYWYRTLESQTLHANFSKDYDKTNRFHQVDLFMINTYQSDIRNFLIVKKFMPWDIKSRDEIPNPAVWYPPLGLFSLSLREDV